jgi:hypothetical protein
VPVVILKNEPKCKICSSDFRTDIDDLLLLRSKRQHDADGNRVNEQYVLEKCAFYGIRNPTLDNIRNHWKLHCSVESTEVIEAAAGAQLKALEEVMAGGEHANLDEALRTIVSLGVAGFKEKVAKGQNPITVDHVLKAAAELTRRSHNEAQEDLLSSLVGGIGAALSQAKAPKQIAGAEVIIDAVLEEA